MPRKTTPVKITEEQAPGGGKQTCFEHESFASVRVSHVTGIREIFGSSITHHSWIELTITRNKKYRHLSNDWYMPGKELITIALSPAQFGEMLCSFSRHSGVPCSLSDFDMNIVPEPDSVHTSNKETYVREFEKHAATATECLDKVEARLQELMDKPNITKAERKELMSLIHTAKCQYTSGAPFVMRQFIEQTEKVVAEAKSEVEAFTADTITKAGLNAIQVQHMPELKTLEDNDETTYSHCPMDGK